MDVAVDVDRATNGNDDDDDDDNDDDDDDEMYRTRSARGTTHVPDAERQLSRAPRGRELYTRETGIDRTGACARPFSWSSFSTYASTSSSSSSSTATI